MSMDLNIFTNDSVPPSSATVRPEFSTDGREWHSEQVIGPLWRRILSRFVPFMTSGGDNRIRFIVEDIGEWSFMTPPVAGAGFYEWDPASSTYTKMPR